jgi:2-amino-4-hydroxy-6-hydroxymethyldihydropteridine diphosphokinase
VLHIAYISLGSNVGDRLGNVQDAIARMGELGEVVRVSSWYETEPVEFTEQPWFLNGVVDLRTELAARALMQELLKIERAMGRERNRPKGPRNIDLDLLLIDNDIVNTPDLTVPHPSMHERRFVLAPLAEIAPNAKHPILHATALQLLESLPAGDEVRRVEEP